MAIAFVKNGGTNGNKTAGTTSLSATVPAGGHAAGNLVVVALSASKSQGGIVTETVTDTRGNTYTLIEYGDTTGIEPHCYVYASVLTTALQAGDTITVAIGGAFSYSKVALTTAEFSGASTTEDVASTFQRNTSSVTTPSAGPITPPSAATLVLGAVGPMGPTGDTFTQDSDTAGGSAWTAGAIGGTTGGSATTNVTVRLAYKITTSSASQTYNPTLGTGRTCVILIAALQPTASGIAKTGYGKENG